MQQKTWQRIGRGLLATAGCFVLAQPAMALTTVGACDAALTSPAATACSGYYEGNLFGGSPAKIGCSSRRS